MDNFQNASFFLCCGLSSAPSWHPPSPSPLELFEITPQSGQIWNTHSVTGKAVWSFLKMTPFSTVQILCCAEAALRNFIICIHPPPHPPLILYIDTRKWILWMSKANHKNLHAFIWELLLDLEKCQSKAKDCSVMAKIQTLGKLWIYYAIIKKMVVLSTQRLCSMSVPLTDGYEWMDFTASSLSAPLQASSHLPLRSSNSAHWVSNFKWL